MATNYVGYLSVDGKIILKCILRNSCAGLNGFNKLKTEIRGGFL
jgi:hypothetical protein